MEVVEATDLTTQTIVKIRRSLGEQFDQLSLQKRNFVLHILSGHIVSDPAVSVNDLVAKAYDSRAFSNAIVDISFENADAGKCLADDD